MSDDVKDNVVDEATETDDQDLDSADVDYEGPDLNQDSDDSQEGERDGEEPSQSYRSQDEVDRAIEKRLQRERRKLAKMFGVTKLDELSPFVEAGRAVSTASGLKPQEVAQKMSQYQNPNNPNPNSQYPPSANTTQLDQKITKIESMLEEDKVTRARQLQEAEAKKEFGNLYDEHREDIEDKAEDLGLSLVDAAAVVLRPKLKEHIATQQQKKQSLRSKRNVEGSDGQPVKKDSPATKLSESQRAIADRYGISHEAYFNQLQRRGKI